MIRDLTKKTLLKLPLLPIRRQILRLREGYQRKYASAKERSSYPLLPNISKKSRPIKNVMVYMLHGMHHSGTDKSLQIIANALASKYKVVFLYGDKHVDPKRQRLIDPRVKQISFSYTDREMPVPHFIHDMTPHFKEVLSQENIDVIITASAGHAEYPWNTVENIPIVLINLFGSPTIQNNVTDISFVSPLAMERASSWTGILPGSHVNWLPCGRALPNTRELGAKLRRGLNIPENDFVFGRIGRADDGIYDPIGIKAWQRIADNYPHAHFIIKSPPPKLVNFLDDNPLPNVHLLPPTGDEIDVWSFHGAIDAMAHFRYDGETGGVAIGESLSVGNPIITHRSHIANAHLDYLTPDCSRVAGLDDDEEYARHMEEFIDIKIDRSAEWERMRMSASDIAIKKFSTEKFGTSFCKIIESKYL